MKHCNTATLILAVVSLAALGPGCGERPDELGPYVERLKQADVHNKKLVEYRNYLKADQSDKAANLSKAIEAYLADMETFGQTRDKVILAGHNALKRKLQGSLKKIVEPDFPTFMISALKQINLIEKAYQAHAESLQKRWEEEGRTAAFTLAWPAEQ
jgi:hypothetical protein